MSAATSRLSRLKSTPMTSAAASVVAATMTSTMSAKLTSATRRKSQANTAVAVSNAAMTHVGASV